MNEKRRKKVRGIIHDLERAAESVSSVCYEEDDSLDSLPSNLQDGECARRMEQSISDLTEAIDCIIEAQQKLGDSIAK